MFDKSPSLILSLAIHVAVAVALLTAHFTVESGMIPRRNTRVQLIAPIAPPPVKRMKQIAVRMPAKPPHIQAIVKLPAPTVRPLTPPVTQTLAPAIKAPPIIAEPPPIPAAVQTDVFASAQAPKANRA